jgi:hypothetical protein
MTQRKSEENVRIQKVLNLVHELTTEEQQQLFEHLKLENLRREIQIGIDEADRGELVTLEELNEHLDAIQQKYV